MNYPLCVSCHPTLVLWEKEVVSFFKDDAWGRVSPSHTREHRRARISSETFKFEHERERPRLSKHKESLGAWWRRRSHTIKEKELPEIKRVLQKEKKWKKIKDFSNAPSREERGRVRTLCGFVAKLEVYTKPKNNCKAISFLNQKAYEYLRDGSKAWQARGLLKLFLRTLISRGKEKREGELRWEGKWTKVERKIS